MLTSAAEIDDAIPEWYRQKLIEEQQCLIEANENNRTTILVLSCVGALLGFFAFNLWAAIGIGLTIGWLETEFWSIKRHNVGMRILINENVWPAISENIAPYTGPLK